MRISLFVILSLGWIWETRSAALVYKRRRLENERSTTPMPNVQEVNTEETKTSEPIGNPLIARSKHFQESIKIFLLLEQFILMMPQQQLLIGQSS